MGGWEDVQWLSEPGNGFHHEDSLNPRPGGQDHQGGRRISLLSAAPRGQASAGFSPGLPILSHVLLTRLSPFSFPPTPFSLSLHNQAPWKITLQEFLIRSGGADLISLTHEVWSSFGK